MSRRVQLTLVITSAALAAFSATATVQQAGPRPVRFPVEKSLGLLKTIGVSKRYPSMGVSSVAEIGRILHFPRDCSLGSVMVRDANVGRDIKTFHFWTGTGDNWERLCEAKGDVRVPAGKAVKLLVYSKNLRNIDRLKAIRANDLYSLHFYGDLDPRKMPDDRCMEHISHLTGLKELRIKNTRITSRGLFKIRNLQQLERLWLGEGITNTGMRVVGSLKSLKYLYLTKSPITNIGIAKLCETLSLEELAINDCRVDDEGLKHLAGMDTLKYLMLSGDNFTDAGTEHVKNIASLKILHAGGATSITDAGVKHLSEHSGLERISFHWNGNITNEGAKHLGTMKLLKMLDVTNSKIDDAGMADLAKIKMLEYLDLPHTGITNAGLAHIAKLQNLKYLRGGSTGKSALNDESLSYIGKLENLHQLGIGGSGFSDEGMDHIAQLSCLEALSLFKAGQLTNKGFAKLGRLQSLEELFISGSPNVSIEGLKSLNNLKGLTKLYLHEIAQDGSVMDISGLVKLEDLNISTPRGSDKLLTDADLACLGKLKKLKHIQLDLQSPIGDEGLKHLSGLENLGYLCIGGGNITDEGLSHLKGMKKLQSLTLYSPRLTDKGLRHLEELTGLLWLSIYNNDNISDEALARLNGKLPYACRIEIRRNEQDKNLKKTR